MLSSTIQMGGALKFCANSLNNNFVARTARVLALPGPMCGSWTRKNMRSFSNSSQNCWYQPRVGSSTTRTTTVPESLLSRRSNRNPLGSIGFFLASPRSYSMWLWRKKHRKKQKITLEVTKMGKNAWFSIASELGWPERTGIIESSAFFALTRAWLTKEIAVSFLPVNWQLLFWSLIISALNTWPKKPSFAIKVVEISWWGMLFLLGISLNSAVIWISGSVCCLFGSPHLRLVLFSIFFRSSKSFTAVSFANCGTTF